MWHILWTRRSRFHDRRSTPLRQCTSQSASSARVNNSVHVVRRMMVTLQSNNIKFFVYPRHMVFSRKITFIFNKWRVVMSHALGCVSSNTNESFNAAKTQLVWYPRVSAKNKGTTKRERRIQWLNIKKRWIPRMGVLRKKNMYASQTTISYVFCPQAGFVSNPLCGWPL